MSDPGDALARGAELFDAGEHLEAHETWEAAWRIEPRGTSRSRLLQGLAQCAAAAIKLQRGELRGARSLAQKGARLVEEAAGEKPPHAHGWDLIEFVRGMRSLSSELPRLIRSRE